MSDTNTLETPLTAAEPTEAGTGGPQAIFDRWNQLHPQQEESTTEQPAKEEPAKEESAAAEAEEAPKGEPAKESPQKIKWNELKTKADELDKLKAEVLPAREKELAELKEKVEKMSAVDASKFEAEIANRQKQIDEYAKKLAVFDIRESPQFQSEVLAPMGKIGSDMDRLAATYKISAQDLKDALTIQDPAAQMARLSELTGDMTDIHKAKVWNAVDQLQELSSKALSMEQNAMEVKKEMEFIKSQEAEKKKTENQRQLQASADAVKKQFLEKLPDFFKDEAISKDVFSADLSKDDPVSRSYNAYAGQALPHMAKQLTAAQAEIASLKKTLAERSSVSPKAGGGQTSQHADTGSAVPEGSSMMARWNSYQTQKA